MVTGIWRVDKHNSVGILKINNSRAYTLRQQIIWNQNTAFNTFTIHETSIYEKELILGNLSDPWGPPINSLIFDCMNLTFMIEFSKSIANNPPLP